MRSIRVQYEDGNYTDTNCNGTDEEIRAYYVGTRFNFGDRFDGDPDRMVMAIGVDFYPDLTICPHCGHGQLPVSRLDGRCNIRCCGKMMTPAGVV